MDTGNPYAWTVRIRLRRDGEVVYGSGISRLLVKTDERGSLHLAAKEMGMSYRKALRLVKQAEAYFGKPLLKKTIGGAGGGGSELTGFAQSFVYRFQEMEGKVSDYTHRLAEEYFPDLEP